MNASVLQGVNSPGDNVGQLSVSMTKYPRIIIDYDGGKGLLGLRVLEDLVTGRLAPLFRGWWQAEHNGRGRATLLNSHGTENGGGGGWKGTWVPIFLSGLRKWR